MTPPITVPVESRFPFEKAFSDAVTKFRIVFRRVLYVIQGLAIATEKKQPIHSIVPPPAANTEGDPHGRILLCVGPRLRKSRSRVKSDASRSVDADEFGKEDKWIYEAMRNTDLSSWPDGEHSAEALGPRIQGNTLGLDQHLCAPFNLEIPSFDRVDRTYDGLRQALADLESQYSPSHLAEGIVFHHPDGRRAKIKRKDFAA